VASKTKAALEGGLGVILCCGESLEVGFVELFRYFIRDNGGGGGKWSGG